MKPIITQKDIAQETGLDQSTVSLALRDDPRVSSRTRKRVLATARKLGYRKDPMLTALASYRGDRQQKTYHGTLAWLNDPEVYKLDYYEDSVYYHYRAGAQAQALQHGYKLEIFEVEMEAPNQRRLSEILYHRGIEGIILPPLRHAGPALKLEWEHFAVVTFGWTVMEPHFHCVSPNHYYNGTETVRNFRALGYQRIGAVLFMPPKDVGKWHYHLWAQGVETSVFTTGGPGAVPTLRLTSCERDQAEVFQAWYRKYRPDAIAMMMECSDFVEDSLKEIGIQAPRDVGLACFVYRSQQKHLAGVRENSPYIGKAAVDMLVGTIRRREFGAPPVRRMLQIDGSWEPGKSVRKQTGRAASTRKKAHRG